MTPLEIIIIALGVSVDAFAVSVGGALCPSRRAKWSCALNAGMFFGGFQFFMPLIGFFAAGLLTDLLAACDHYIAFALLGYVGGKMVWDGVFAKENEEKDSCKVGDFFAPKALIIPAFATSMDALAVGAGIAFAGNAILVPSVSMGIATGVISAIGVFAGKRLGKFAGERPLTIIGGTAIILIGLKILLTDLGVFAR